SVRIVACLRDGDLPGCAIDAVPRQHPKLVWSQTRVECNRVELSSFDGDRFTRDESLCKHGRKWRTRLWSRMNLRTGRRFDISTSRSRHTGSLSLVATAVLS